MRWPKDVATVGPQSVARSVLVGLLVAVHVGADIHAADAQVARCLGLTANIIGTQGDDTTHATDGNDTLTGGAGIDYCDGGPGSDATDGWCERTDGVP